jgi:hypothetical protein
MVHSIFEILGNFQKIIAKDSTKLHRFCENFSLFANILASSFHENAIWTSTKPGN